MGLQAQKVDIKGLNTFIDRLKALEGEHVLCDVEDEEEFLENSFAQTVFGAVKLSPDKFWSKETIKQCVQIASTDKEGYKAVFEILDEYDVTDCEELFGIPLSANQREDGEQNIVFMGEDHTFIVFDDGENVSILYTPLSLFGWLSDAINSIVSSCGETVVGSVDLFGGLKFSFSSDDGGVVEKNNVPTASADDVLDILRATYKAKIAHLNSELSNAKNEEQREKLTQEITELKEKMNEEVEKLDELEAPSFVKIPSTDKHYVAIPKVSEEQKGKMEPYALSGVYDWINKTGFAKGASMSNFDQISCIITPMDVVKQYAIRHLPREAWYFDGFSDEYKEVCAAQYQGGTPAVLYRFSQNEAGYNDMLADLGFFFDLEKGDVYKGLEVVAQSNRDGKRFAQLYGEGNVVVSILDLPEEKYSHFSIIVGGVGAFEQAVNNCAFGGKKNIAENCNVIINSDLGDYSYGIHFTTNEYFYAGKARKAGVHIDFGYNERFTK